MDVHPPHQPVHTWREALIHVGLMTVGLFIALMLEGLVEYIHHRHIVHQAHLTIRKELEANHKAAQAELTDADADYAHLKADLGTLSQMQAQPHHHVSLEFNMSAEDFSDAAWRSARDTGALGYMPYDEVETYASIYGMQTVVTDSILAQIRQRAEIAAPLIASDDFASLPKSTLDQMSAETARAIADVHTLRQLTEQLDARYVDALKQD